LIAIIQFATGEDSQGIKMEAVFRSIAPNSMKIIHWDGNSRVCQKHPIAKYTPKEFYRALKENCPSHTTVVIVRIDREVKYRITFLRKKDFYLGHVERVDGRGLSLFAEYSVPSSVVWTVYGGK